MLNFFSLDDDVSLVDPSDSDFVEMGQLSIAAIFG